MRQEILKKGFGATYFENNVDIYEFLKEAQTSQGYCDYLQECKNERKRWSGNVLYDEATQNLLYGNKDITPKFIEGLKALGLDTEANTGVFMNHEGFAYDMGAVVSGEPECCVDMTAPQAKKTIRVYLDYTAHAGIGVNSITNRGIAIVNLLYTLMSQGFIVEFNLCRVSELHYTGKINNEEIRNHYISIKVPTETLTIGTLGFYCSLEFFRIIMIIAECFCCHRPDSAGELNGTKNRDKYNLEKDAFFIPSFYMDESAEHKCYSLEGAQKYINGLYDQYCQEHNLKGE